MNLYLIRHSISEKAFPGKKDFDRQLIESGIKLISNAALNWNKIITNLDLIFTSPYIRAVQTAEIIKDNIEQEVRLVKENVLAAGCSTGSLIDTISVYEEKNIAVVGHQPDLSNHVVNFCGDQGFNLKFKPATIAKISFDSKIGFGKGMLEFIIPAEAY